MLFGIGIGIGSNATWYDSKIWGELGRITFEIKGF